MKRAFTLVELLLVLTIVVVIASLAVQRFGGTVRGAEVTVAEHDLVTIREAILRMVGDMEGVPHFHKVNPLWGCDELDEVTGVGVHRLFAPTNAIVDLAVVPPTNVVGAAAVAAWEAAGLGYIPARCCSGVAGSAAGWKGPYLTPARAVCRGMTYGIPDPWGNEYRLQVPSAELCLEGTDDVFPAAWRPSGADREVSSAFAERRWRFARLVSAGPDGRLDTPRDVFAGRRRDGSVVARGDDIVLFLNRADVWEELE